MEPSENSLLRSLFDQKLDRAVLVSFFLGAIVPLFALALVAVRYGLPALEEAPHERMTLVFGVAAVAILTLASCLALHRLSTAARARMDGDNARLNSLVAVSQSLAEAKDPQAVAEASTPCARRIANASAAFVVRRAGPDKVLALYDSCGEHAASIYGQYEDHFSELIGAALRVSHPVIAENSDESPGASLALPLVRTEGSESVLVVCHLEPGTHFEPEQFDAVRTLAGLTAGVLENSNLQDQLRNFFAHVTDILVAALDSFVDGRVGHAENVARMVNQLGRELALDEEHLRRLHFAALLHDIGMLRVDRPGHTDPNQFKKHPRIGHRMMSRIRLWENAAPSVLHHHEWYDGSGYPEGLTGEEIPYDARIIAVADAFDAMTRPLGDGRGLTPEAALDEIRNGAGTQFDPEIAAAFERLATSGEISTDSPQRQDNHSEVDLP